MCVAPLPTKRPNSQHRLQLSFNVNNQQPPASRFVLAAIILAGALSLQTFSTESGSTSFTNLHGTKKADVLASAMHSWKVTHFTISQRRL